MELSPELAAAQAREASANAQRAAAEAQVEQLEQSGELDKVLEAEAKQIVPSKGAEEELTPADQKKLDESQSEEPEEDPKKSPKEKPQEGKEAPEPDDQAKDDKPESKKPSKKSGVKKLISQRNQYKSELEQYKEKFGPLKEADEPDESDDEVEEDDDAEQQPPAEEGKQEEIKLPPRADKGLDEAFVRKDLDTLSTRDSQAKEYRDDIEKVMLSHPTLTAYQAWQMVKGQNGILDEQAVNQLRAKQLGISANVAPSRYADFDPKSVSDSDLEKMLREEDKAGNLDQF